MWEKVIRGFEVSLCLLFGHDWGGETGIPECPYIPKIKCASHVQHHCSRCGCKDEGRRPGPGWKACSQKYDSGLCLAERTEMEKEELEYLTAPSSVGFGILLAAMIVGFVFVVFSALFKVW